MARGISAANSNRKSKPAGNDQVIGSAVRDLRESQGISARQLAQKSGVSAAMISRIESDQVSPSLSTMTSLSDALGVSLVSLFRDIVSEHTDYTHVRQGTGAVSTRLVGPHIHHYVNLATHRRRDLNFEAHLITVTPQDCDPPRYVGHGVVFMHVLKGSARYSYGKQEFTLSEGDSLSMDAELTYGFTEILSPEFVFVNVQAEAR